MRQIFTCSYCQYKSNRLFNVVRHEGRIHTKKKSKICCGELLSSKADYYAHCELFHPQARAHTYISKDKYKITADSLAVERLHHHRVQEREEKNTMEGGRTYNLRVRRKYTGSFRSSRTQRNVNSKLSLEYSLTYSGLDIENIPLICFLQNQNPSDLQKLAVAYDCAEEMRETSNTPPLEPTTKSDCLSVLNHFDFDTEFQNGIQSIEQTATKIEEQDESASEPTSPISPMTMPPKKLILHRFQSSFGQEFKVNLCDANNNCQEMNIMETSSESFTTLVQTVKNKTDKENGSSYEFSVEQKLNIKLDRSVTVPLTTQVHRDFLGMIDFESYKIF